MVYPHVCPEVNESRWNWESDTTSTACGLKSSPQSFWVIVGFTVLKSSLDYWKGFSTKLERRDFNLFEVYAIIDNIKSDIQCLKDDIGEKFQRWYNEAKQLPSYICTKEEMARVPRVQCNIYVECTCWHTSSFLQEINWHSFYKYLTERVAEPFSADNFWPMSTLPNRIQSFKGQSTLRK